MFIIAISGAIASGKSSLALALENQGYDYLSTREFIQNHSLGTSREHLQAVGNSLDEVDPDWVLKFVEDGRGDDPSDVVIDAVRKLSQLESLRKRHQVLHVHLTARVQDLAKRYQERSESSAYEVVKSDRTERAVCELESDADIIINTSNCTPEDTLLRVLNKIRPQLQRRNVDVLIGGQYGSEGKGHIAAHLAPEYGVLVRVGGPNAGHTVIYKGKKVSFYHLPSGILHAPDATIYLGAGININLKVLKKEIDLAEELLGHDIQDQLCIDQNANIVTGADIAAEAGLVAGIGSTGQGVGFATAGRILGRGERKLVKDLGGREQFNFGFNLIRDGQREIFEDTDHDMIMLEGTQGTGLSLYHGPYPYVTSRDTTASGTMADAGIAPGRIRKVVMVVRTNPIRVQSPSGGTSGPMSKEIAWEDVSERSGVDANELRERERTTTTKRLRRVSEFDWALLQKAARLNYPTDLALTFADYLSPENTKARRFDQLTPETQDFINEVETVAAAPVSLITTRCHERSIIDRRRW